MLYLWFFSINTLAAAPLTDYHKRLTQAIAIAQPSAAHPQPGDEQLAQLQKLRQLLPAQEEVEASGQFVRVDNRWLHETLDSLITQPEESPARLAELADRLAALQQRLATDNVSGIAGESMHDRLKGILAKPEYQQEQRQGSVIKEWVTELWRKLLVMLRKLFGTRNQAQPSQFTLNLTRLLIGSAVLLALCYALYKLVRWAALHKRREEPERGPREILGEVISEAATTEDLLATASTLANQGDYRGAIRRAYIALLFELEQRGKLRLHRAKTNRDYLEALRNEARLYPSFVALTRIFERNWYGHANATEFDFEGFLTGYREALGENSQ